MIEQLREKAAKSEEMETQFLLSDQAYAKAVIPPTDKVFWNQVRQIWTSILIVSKLLTPIDNVFTLKLGDSNTKSCQVFSLTNNFWRNSYRQYNDLYI